MASTWPVGLLRIPLIIWNWIHKSYLFRLGITSSLNLLVSEWWIWEGTSLLLQVESVQRGPAMLGPSERVILNQFPFYGYSQNYEKRLLNLPVCPSVRIQESCFY